MIVSADEFYRLRTSEDPKEYRRSAQEEASEEVWLDVIRSYPDMKIWVVHNKRVPLGILRLLLDDKDNSIRGAIAQKRKLDEDMFEKLSRDPDESVRHTLACNRKIPLKILKRLCCDLSDFVSKAAIERLQQIQED